MSSSTITSQPSRELQTVYLLQYGEKVHGVPTQKPRSVESSRVPQREGFPAVFRSALFRPSNGSSEESKVDKRVIQFAALNRSTDTQGLSMELRHLRYFVAVAEQKGFREASRFLHVSQPAISKTLTQLEQELGTKLFARSGRTVRLTPQGEVFYEETLRTLKQSDHAAEAARRAARGEIGTLSLGFCSVATAGFLPTIVRQYKELLPGVRLLLREMNPTCPP